MERFYSFAGITWRITGDPDGMYREDGVLTPFRREGPSYDHSLEFEIAASLPEPRGTCVFHSPRKAVFLTPEGRLTCMGEVARSPENAYLHILRAGDHSHVRVLRQAVPDRIMPRLVLNCLEAEHRIIRRGGFLLHASFIAWEGRAILFTAPSGTGKSTQAALWQQYRGAEPINGDRAAVTVEPGGVTAWGIPFCGTSGISKNAALPLAAIVFLSQAPVSAVTRLKGLTAFRRVWEGCSVHVWDKEDMDRCTRSVMAAVEQVPVYHLACTPDEAAVAVLESILKKGE